MRRLRRHEAVFAAGVVSVGNATEGVDVAQEESPDGAHEEAVTKLPMLKEAVPSPRFFTNCRLSICIKTQLLISRILFPRLVFRNLIVWYRE